MDTIPQAALTIAERYRVPADQIRPLPAGQANHVLALGEHLVLRTAHTPHHLPDLRKEAQLLPLAHTAGVRTTALVEFTEPPCS